jgi:hypothetical protein
MDDTLGCDAGCPAPRDEELGLMDTAAVDNALVTSSLTDVRQAPLDRLSAPQTLDRLRPAEHGRPAVAAFNSAL